MATSGLAIMTSCGLRDEGSYDYTSAPLQHEATRWHAATFDAAATPSVSLSYWDLWERRRWHSRLLRAPRRLNTPMARRCSPWLHVTWSYTTLNMSGSWTTVYPGQTPGYTTCSPGWMGAPAHQVNSYRKRPPRTTRPPKGGPSHQPELPAT